MRIALFCLASSLLLISFFNVDALVAPVLKMLAYVKVFFAKTVVDWLSGAYSAIKKWLAKFVIFLGGWEAWSMKKMFRHATRFVATMSARIIVLNFLINLFVGKERKGIKNVPLLVLRALQDSWVGQLIDWWKQSSDRTKRIVTGVILCVLLIAIGQALIGVSILLFDIVWECVIVLSRLLLKAWRWVSPIILRMIPNFIGSFVTTKVVPFFTSVVPVVKDDHRVIFVRIDLRERYREYKKRLLKFSRTKRPTVRATIRPLVSTSMRRKKDKLLNKAANINSGED